MMKNKLFVSLLFALTLGFVLVSCKPEVEVFESSKKIANATLIGTDSIRAGGVVDGAKFTVVEYKFLPNNKAIRTESTFGDGVYEAPSAMNLSYTMEYAKDYVGLNITFTPEDGAPFDVYFNENVLIENGTDTLSETVAQLANLEKIKNDLPNTTWYFKDSTLWIDTTVVDTIKMTITSSRVPGPNGRPIIVKDTTYDTLQYELYDTLGTMTYTNIEFSLNRDANTLANNGHYYYEYSEYTKDSVKVAENSILKDYDATWGLYSIMTARRFGVRMMSKDNKQQDDLAISLYNLSSGTLKVGGTTEFKLKK